MVAAGKISPAVAAIYAMNLSPEEAQAMYVGPKAKGWKDLPNKFSSLMDKMERAEISDAGAKLYPSANTPSTLGDFLKHDALYNQYPEMRNIKVVEMPGYERGSSVGSYGDNVIKIARGETLDERYVPTTLHEIQHVIQEKEGWARGGNPKEFLLDNLKEKDKLWNKYEELIKIRDKAQKIGDKESEYKYHDMAQDAFRQWDNITAEGTYRRLSGEIEARDTAARMGLTSAQRQASLPYAGQGIPLKDAITKMGVAAPVGAILAEQLAERRKREQQEALRDSYSPVDLGVAFATGGAGFLQKLVSAISDAGLDYLLADKQ